MNQRFSPIVVLSALALSFVVPLRSSSIWLSPGSPSDPVGVLVLCPGMNQDGRFFFAEDGWMDFAREEGLAVVTVGFRSDTDDLYSSDRRGYYWPEQGSGREFLDFVDEHVGIGLPILIYGFSGGAQFASRFVEWVPARIMVWAAYSAQFWDAPLAGGVMPPGMTVWLPNGELLEQSGSLHQP